MPQSTWETTGQAVLLHTLFRSYPDRLWPTSINPKLLSPAVGIQININVNGVARQYRGADKSLARPGRKKARKHVRDARDFNNIETRAVIKFHPTPSPLRQGKAPKEIHAILTETLAYFLPGRAKDLSAPVYLVQHNRMPQSTWQTTGQAVFLHSLFRLYPDRLWPTSINPKILSPAVVIQINITVHGVARQ